MRVKWHLVCELDVLNNYQKIKAEGNYKDDSQFIAHLLQLEQLHVANHNRNTEDAHPILPVLPSGFDESDNENAGDSEDAASQLPSDTSQLDESDSPPLKTLDDCNSPTLACSEWQRDVVIKKELQLDKEVLNVDGGVDSVSINDFRIDFTKNAEVALEKIDTVLTSTGGVIWIKSDGKRKPVFVSRCGGHYGSYIVKESAVTLILAAPQQSADSGVNSINRPDGVFSGCSKISEGVSGLKAMTLARPPTLCSRCGQDGCNFFHCLTELTIPRTPSPTAEIEDCVDPSEVCSFCKLPVTENHVCVTQNSASGDGLKRTVHTVRSNRDSGQTVNVNINLMPVVENYVGYLMSDLTKIDRVVVQSKPPCVSDAQSDERGSIASNPSLKRTAGVECDSAQNKRLKLGLFPDKIQASKEKLSRPMTFSSVILFGCSICSFSFDNKEGYIRHMYEDKHTPDVVRACVMASNCAGCRIKLQENNKRFWNHVVLCHTGMLHKCNSCLVKFLSREDFDFHMEFCADSKSQQPKFCYKLNLSGVNFYICSCNQVHKGFNLAFFNHLRKCKDPSIEWDFVYACSFCPFVSDEKSDILQHFNLLDMEHYAVAKIIRGAQYSFVECVSVVEKANHKLLRCQKCFRCFFGISDFDSHHSFCNKQSTSVNLCVPACTLTFNKVDMYHCFFCLKSFTFLMVFKDGDKNFHACNILTSVPLITKMMLCNSTPVYVCCLCSLRHHKHCELLDHYSDMHTISELSIFSNKCFKCRTFTTWSSEVNSHLTKVHNCVVWRCNTCLCEHPFHIFHHCLPEISDKYQCVKENGVWKYICRCNGYRSSIFNRGFKDHCVECNKSKPVQCQIEPEVSQIVIQPRVGRPSSHNLKIKQMKSKIQQLLTDGPVVQQTVAQPITKSDVFAKRTTVLEEEPSSVSVVTFSVIGCPLCIRSYCTMGNMVIHVREVHPGANCQGLNNCGCSRDKFCVKIFCQSHCLALRRCPNCKCDFYHEHIFAHNKYCNANASGKYRCVVQGVEGTKCLVKVYKCVYCKTVLQTGKSIVEHLTRPPFCLPRGMVTVGVASPTGGNESLGNAVLEDNAPTIEQQTLSIYKTNQVLVPSSNPVPANQNETDVEIIGDHSSRSDSEPEDVDVLSSVMTCPYCPSVFQLYVELAEHCKWKHKDDKTTCRNPDCTLCDGKRQASLGVFLQEHSQFVPYCRTCKKVYLTADFKAHRKHCRTFKSAHFMLLGTNYCCVECPFATWNLTRLRKHKSHFPELDCSVVISEVEPNDCIENLMNTTDFDKEKYKCMFMCFSCAAVYPVYQQLVTHLKLQHASEGDYKPGEHYMLLLQCKMCSCIIFFDHISVHEGVCQQLVAGSFNCTLTKDYMCDRCSQTSDSLTGIIDHMAVCLKPNPQRNYPSLQESPLDEEVCVLSVEPARDSNRQSGAGKIPDTACKIYCDDEISELLCSLKDTLCGPLPRSEDERHLVHESAITANRSIKIEPIYIDSEIDLNTDLVNLATNIQATLGDNQFCDDAEISVIRLSQLLAAGNQSVSTNQFRRLFGCPVCPTASKRLQDKAFKTHLLTHMAVLFDDSKCIFCKRIAVNQVDHIKTHVSHIWLCKKCKFHSPSADPPLHSCETESRPVVGERFYFYKNGDCLKFFCRLCQHVAGSFDDGLTGNESKGIIGHLMSHKKSQKKHKRLHLTQTGNETFCERTNNQEAASSSHKPDACNLKSYFGCPICAVMSEHPHLVHNHLKKNHMKEIAHGGKCLFCNQRVTPIPTDHFFWHIPKVWLCTECNWLAAVKSKPEHDCDNEKRPCIGDGFFAYQTTGPDPIYKYDCGSCGFSSNSFDSESTETVSIVRHLTFTCIRSAIDN